MPLHQFSSILPAMAKNFGEEIRDRREKLGIEQQALAQKSGITSGMLNHIETGRNLPSKRTREKLFDALNLDKETQRRLLKLVEQEKGQRKQKPKERSEFGRAFKKVLDELNIKPSDFSDKSNFRLGLVNLWAGGTKNPGEKTLTDEIVPHLKRFNVNEFQINALKLAHLEDTIKRNLELSYLSERTQGQILSAALREAKKHLPTKDQYGATKTRKSVVN